MSKLDMDAEQQLCRDLITKGHNLCILGQAGTGKTFTVKNVVLNLQKSRNVALTCYTGIACLQYKGLKPTTLHRFGGLEDGRHSKEKLAHLLKTDEHFASTAKTIKETECLVIDEVSMVSKRVFETVEYVCRQLKEPTQVFGGMQVILSGDFFQLPPIKDELYGDNGDYCFNASFFSSMFPHIIELSNIHRQTEPDLIKAVNELEHGSPSEHTNEFIRSLARPLRDQDDPSKIVRLHARNFDADLSNYRYLQTIDTQLHTYAAEDHGDSYYLKKFIAPKQLGVKIGAKVMLLRNIDDIHVNGSVGTVVAVSKEWIKVDFDSVILRIEKYMFSKFDPVTSIAIATRYQFPLRVAHAITIHKSQGMSLPVVEVDCKNVTNPGQLGVAVGRAMSSEGLRVLNYSPNIARKHPASIYNFYEHITKVKAVGDTSDCCKHDQSLIIAQVDRDEEFSETDSEADLTSELKNLDYSLGQEHSYSSSSVSHTDMVQDFETALHDFTGTPAEEKAREAYEDLLHGNYDISTWYSLQREAIQKIYDDSFPAEPGKYQPKHFTEFYSGFQQHISSEKYTSDAKRICGAQYSSQILTSVMFVIQTNLIRSKSEEVHAQQEDIPTTTRIFPAQETADSAAGLGKVRYVGGCCVAKCRYRICSSLQKCLYVPGMEPEIERLNEQISILDSAIVSQTEIMNISKYPETLQETERKQNVREGLTNITDSTYEFFQEVEKKAKYYMQLDTLHSEKKFFYRYVLQKVLSCTNLLELFIEKWNICARTGSESHRDRDSVEDICISLCITCNHVLEIFNMLVKLFITIMVAQFRKDYLRAIKKEKGVALRKKVIQKAERKQNLSDSVTFQSIMKDTSSSKNVSHLKLKAAALSSETFFTNFTKTEITLLLKAYGVLVMPKKSLKRDLGDRLHSVLIADECVSMVNHCVIGGPERISDQAESNLSAMDTQEQNQPVLEGQHELHESTEEPSSSNQEVDVVATDEPFHHQPDFEEPSQELTASITERSATAGCSRDSEPSVKPKPAIKKKTTGRKRKQTVCKAKAKKGKVGKSRSKKAEIADDDSAQCPICGTFCKEGDDCIYCDSCRNGFHRLCVGLHEDAEWEYFQSYDAVYICPLCQ